jgi:hypothetical protein
LKVGHYSSFENIKAWFIVMELDMNLLR